MVHGAPSIRPLSQAPNQSLLKFDITYYFAINKWKSIYVILWVACTCWYEYHDFHPLFFSM